MIYDLVVAYRLYPGVSKIPIVHKDDKFMLAELGVASLKQSLEGLMVKIYFILDSCPEIYETMISRYFFEPDCEFIRVEKAGNLATFLLQIDLLCKQAHSEYVYFAEDDYLYIRGEFKKMLNFLTKNPATVDFVTCNDHLDYYTTIQHQVPVRVKIGQGKHWFNACSTCLTFLTTQKTLRKTRKVFESFTKGSYDVSLWMVLTKYHILNPFSLIKFSGNRLMLKAIVKAYVHTLPQIFFLRKRNLWVPIPSIGTHLQCTDIAPNINWEQVISDVETNQILKLSK